MRTRTAAANATRTPRAMDSVVMLADALTESAEALDGAAFALVAMLALCARSGAWPGGAAGHGVWRRALPQTWRSHAWAPRLRPPRAA